MTQPTLIEAITVFIGFCTFAFGVGGAFTLGVGLVCRRLNWSPVNITINVDRGDR